MLFVWRGSVLRDIAPQLLATTAFAILVTVLHGRLFAWKIPLNFVPFSLVGLTLALFLGFRNGTSYARYWEARTLWGALLNETRTLVRQALTLADAPSSDVPALTARRSRSPTRSSSTAPSTCTACCCPSDWSTRSGP